MTVEISAPPVVTVSPTGVQGPRGNSVLNGVGAPSSSLGVDGDWYLDTTTPTALVIYGPKTAGAWGAGQPFGGAPPAPASTVATETAYGQTSTAGTSATYARGDHTHGSPALTAMAPATTLGIGQAAALGTATTPARADHVHPVAAAGAPHASAVGDTAATGTATTYAASDHVHARESFGPVTAQTAFGAASTDGAAATVSHSDHQHGTPTLPTASTSTAGIVRLDGTATDIQPVGSAAATGSTGQAADAGHIHPVDTLLAADNGLSWWNYPAINAGGANVPSATNVPGKLTLCRAVFHHPVSATKIWFGVSANDSGATFLNCFAGIYSVSGTTGTLAASTADLSSSLHISAVYSPALSPTGTLPSGEYFIAWLMGAGSTWTTWNLKSSLGGVTANAGLAVPHLNLANLGSGLSALPASVDLTTMTTTLITGGWGSQWYGLS